MFRPVSILVYSSWKRKEIDHLISLIWQCWQNVYNKRQTNINVIIVTSMNFTIIWMYDVLFTYNMSSLLASKACIPWNTTTAKQMIKTFIVNVGKDLNQMQRVKSVTYCTILYFYIAATLLAQDSTKIASAIKKITPKSCQFVMLGLSIEPGPSNQ